MRAVSDDQFASMSIGISVPKVFGLAWAMAGLSAAAAGGIIGNITGLNFDVLHSFGIIVFPVVIVGGLDSIFGAVIAGIIMVVTLWLSRKARTVTKTEVRLGRQEEGYERFESTGLSRAVVRLVSSIFTTGERFAPNALRRWADRRLDRSEFRPAPAADGTVPSFDLIRAAVNLMVASALISLATSLKLPLSTTYVTFMVAMGIVAYLWLVRHSEVTGYAKKSNQLDAATRNRAQMQGSF